MTASEDEARQFTAAFRAMLEWVHGPQALGGSGNEVVRLVRDWVGPDGLAHSVVRRDLAPFEHVNLQVAIDAWTTEPGRGTAQPVTTKLPAMFGCGSQT